MIKNLKFALPLLLLAAPVSAQEPVAEAEGAVTRQTASRESPLLDFEYSWPQSITSETQLVEQLSEDLAKAYEDALKEARETKALVERNDGPFHQNFFTRIWNVAGETPRFVSLVANTDFFTGGAHPNHTSSALLWNRTRHQQVQFADVFQGPDAFDGAVRAQYCELLDVERAKRRGGEVLEGDFSECPSFSELTIFPAGKDGDGPFTSVHLIADPYVAGPYVEGEYEIIVPVSAQLIAALKPEYRGEFSAQPAQ